MARGSRRASRCRLARPAVPLLAIVAVVTVVLGGAAAAVPASSHRADVAAGAVRFTRTGTSCAPRPHTRPGPGHGLLVIGASYSAGVGASSRAAGYVDRLGRLLHLPVRVDAVPGTGFLNPGPRGQDTFAERIDRLPVTPRPSLVLIQGGRDDAGRPPAAEVAAARFTVCLAEQRFAPARVAVLGPVPGSLPARSQIAAVDADLRTACRLAHATYLDPMRQHWITERNLRGYSGHVHDHPDDAGYRYLAGRIAEQLEQTGVVPR